MQALASRIFEIVDDIAAASSVGQVWGAYLEASRCVGLRYGIACYFPLASPDPFRIVAASCPDGWLEQYQSEGLSEGCMIYDRARTSEASFNWRMSEWDESALTPVQHKWYAHNQRYGMVGGLAILHQTRGADMMIVLAGLDGLIDEHDRKVLEFAGRDALLRFRDLGIADPVIPKLSERERECLQWIAAGKTDSEIGSILDLSEKTVNEYVVRAKAKCGVSTRAQAIVMAVRLGIIPR
jgi:DNA-binding CsgD family transcriptional regulator